MKAANDRQLGDIYNNDQEIIMITMRYSPAAELRSWRRRAGSVEKPAIAFELSA